MAYSLKDNHTDSPVPGVSELSLSLPVLNFGQDFRVKEDSDDNLVITNLTSPIDRPETFRISFHKLQDVYKNSGIDPAYYAPSKRGTSVLCQLNDVFLISDDADTAAKPYYAPIQAHMVLKVPDIELITADTVLSVIERMLTGVLGTGKSDSTRLKSLLRGAIAFADM